MSTVDQLLRDGARRLGGLGGSPRLDAELLLGHALGQRREELYRSLFSSVPTEAEERYAALLAERETRRPVAQLVGQRDFWSFTLAVTGATLVPRPETELLVERALARIPADAAWTIADLGTGTGAIALAIARERPACKVLATDLSKPALAVARRNAKALALRNVTFRQGDWFAPLPQAGLGPVALPHDRVEPALHRRGRVVAHRPGTGLRAARGAGRRSGWPRAPTASSRRARPATCGRAAGCCWSTASGRARMCAGC